MVERRGDTAGMSKVGFGTSLKDVSGANLSTDTKNVLLTICIKKKKKGRYQTLYIDRRRRSIYASILGKKRARYIRKFLYL